MMSTCPLADHLREALAELGGAHGAREGHHHLAALLMGLVGFGGIHQRCCIEVQVVLFHEGRDRTGVAHVCSRGAKYRRREWNEVSGERSIDGASNELQVNGWRCVIADPQAELSARLHDHFRTGSSMGR
jgi:hypothetical protein